MALDTADKLLAVMDLGTPWRSPRYAPTASPDILHRFRLLGYYGLYDPSPFLRTGTGRTVTQVNDHGASSPGPFSWSGDTLGYSSGNYVTGSANNGADTYALKFDTGEILPSTAVITGIEIKVTAYSPAATLDLQTLAYGPYAAVYKNGTYQSSASAGQYIATSATEYTIGGSADTLGVTWSAGDTIDIALWVNLYDAVGTTPNCYITDATLTIWYTDGGVVGTVVLRRSNRTRTLLRM